MRIIFIHIYLILLSIVAGISSGKGQNISVQAIVDTNIIVIGDQVKFTFEVKQPKDIKIHFPVLADTLTENIEIIEQLPADTSRRNHELIIRKPYLVTSFDSGIYVIPPFNFEFQSPFNKQIDTISTLPIYFGVQTIMLDTANPEKIADIKIPFEAPITFKEVLPYIGYGFAGALIIAFIIFYIIKRKRNEPIIVRRPKPKDPPHVIAYRELDKLKKDKLWQMNKIKQFHSQVTDIIRTYIEDRFMVPAMEQTTDEILKSFNNNKLLDSVLFNALEEMLRRADLVKFAKAIPLADENEQSLKDAYLIVDKTKEVFRHIEDEQSSDNVIEVSADDITDIDDISDIKELKENNG